MGGEEAVMQGGVSGGGDVSDIFSAFMGGGGRGEGKGNKKKRTKDQG